MEDMRSEIRSLSIKMTHGDETRKFRFEISQESKDYFTDLVQVIKDLYKDFDIKTHKLLYVDEDKENITFDTSAEIMYILNELSDQPFVRMFIQPKRISRTNPVPKYVPPPKRVARAHETIWNTPSVPMPGNRQNYPTSAGSVKDSVRMHLYQLSNCTYLGQAERNVMDMLEPDESTVWVACLQEYDSKIQGRPVFAFQCENRPNQYLREDPAIKSLCVRGGCGPQARFITDVDPTFPSNITLTCIYTVKCKLPIEQTHTFQVMNPIGVRPPAVSIEPGQSIRFVSHPEKESKHGGKGWFLGVDHHSQLITDARMDDPTTYWKPHSYGNNKFRFENVGKPRYFMRMLPTGGIDVKGGKNTKHALVSAEIVEDSQGTKRVALFPLTLEGRALGVSDEGLPYSLASKREDFFLFPTNLPIAGDS
jgi:hypothetical protein